jgi:hypothetical protein
MLTDKQVEIIEIISGSTAFGVLAGAVIGVLVGAAVSAIRRGSLAMDVAVVAVSAIAPSAVAGTLAGMTTAIGIVAFGQPGWKGQHYAIPDWTASVQLAGIVLCAALATMRTIADRGKQYKRRSLVLGQIAWSLIGALIGALAGVGRGFNGYFVLQSNEGPIRCAVIGAIVIGGSAFLWRLVIDRMDQSLPPTPPAR